MANKLFEHLPQIKTKLIDYMLTVNENINWEDFFNQNGTLSDTRILRRIRSLVWVDKDLEYDNGMSITPKYFKYYMSLLYKFLPKITNYPIYIIQPKQNGGGSIIDEFVREIETKYSILCRILSLMRKEYVIIKDEDITKGSVDISNINVLLPIGSLTYKQEEMDIFKTFDRLVIADSYDNLCFNEEDRILNNIILNVKALILSADDVSEIINTNYTMFTINIPET